MTVVQPVVVPSRSLLGGHAARYAAGASLVALAAAVVHHTGHADQRWQYAAIAAALLPQVLIDLLGMRDARRREGLHVSRRPALLLVAVALVLLSAALVGVALGLATAVVLAAALAGAGLAVAGAPPTVRIPARRRRRRS